MFEYVVIEFICINILMLDGPKCNNVIIDVLIENEDFMLEFI